MKLRKIQGGMFSFVCPGCADVHVIDSSRWRLRNPEGEPTVEPSLLVTCGHYVAGKPEDGDCWCTWNKQHPDQKGPECYRCHSFIRDGQIQFLGDSTHALAGKTVPLPTLTPDNE